MKEKTYFVKGMHCASCELLIEKKLLEQKGVKSAEASTVKGEALIEYKGQPPKIDQLNRLMSEQNYVFSDEAITPSSSKKLSDWLIGLGIGLLIVIAFLAFGKLGLNSLVTVNSSSSLPLFFVFGLLAGISSCAALVGGMILSMAKQWGSGTRPPLLFNTGRLISFAFFGGILGLIGKGLQPSLGFTSFLVIGISLMMLILGLQMLGVEISRRFAFSLPKPITRFIAKEDNFRGNCLPFFLGVLTFFLPCGFTLVAQSSALISGKWLQGSLIMIAFALGTLPMLLVISFSSAKVFQNHKLASRFGKVAGVLVIFFALFNLNSQFNRLGWPSLSNLTYQPVAKANSQSNVTADDTAPIVDGKQLLKMSASSQGYSPNYFKVKAGLPVRWEITDTGTSGCTNAVIAPKLFEGSIPLTPGNISTKEFTPLNTGRYKFNCWMGMISGIIEVVGQDGQTPTSIAPASTDTVTGEGGSSGGCGGSCGGGCGCGGR